MISKSLEISLLKRKIIQFRNIWENVDMLIGIVSDHQITQQMYCVMLLFFSCFFLKKAFVILACFVVSKYAVFIWILGFQWLMQFHQYKSLQDYRQPFSICKPNEEWPHIVLPCHNESEKELFYMKWLIKDRLTRVGKVDVFVKYVMLVLVYRIFYRNKLRAARNERYVDSKTLT